ncbi:hypothetical protein [Botrimarina mediterranea]|uniref:Uncharacterized protein n=1 Tax=Botrimarina mediterranea TaxID=2528022 RepID=A0A518K5L2_9BACT|nr:hypothetical protein [Botrimarina mediterranea]QDV73065.1 hypothetical protein Spa11_12540 [Botrimarina mediterranea]
MTDLQLPNVEPFLHKRALDFFDAGDASGMLGCFESPWGLNIVYTNINSLIDRGIYEAALLDAYVGTSTNNRHWSIKNLPFLFGLADKQRLLESGDPLPEGDAFTIFRGVSGKNPYRKVRSYSWTLDEEKASYFANRFFLDDPAVYVTTVNRDEILAFCNEREEQEVICLPHSCKRLAVGSNRTLPTASIPCGV